MKDSLFSPAWYRVSALKPRLRTHIDIHRHTYRGQLWYLLQDHASGKFQRFTPAAYFLIGLMDGERTVEQIWLAGRSRFSDEAPTQEEVVRLLSQLHAADALQSDVSPDILELLQRFEKKQSQKWKQNLRNPLSIRFPIFDPEALLTRFAPVVKPLFGWFGGLLWLVVVTIGAVLAALHWPDLTKDISDRVFAPSNIISLWIIYPLVKVLHEFGHAFVVKILGGQVHEMGVMFLVFTPVPYVDASSSIAFRNKWHRILVGAAGIGVELFLAALALVVWASVQPGAVRSVMYNIALIGGVSSILFNGNPLLRYDGYYMLTDLIEIPNLGTRGNRYLLYLAQHFGFGLHDAEPPLSTAGERVWFVIYTISSFLYRVFIYLRIVQFIAGKFMTLGLLLGAWAVVSMFVLPLFKGVKYLLSSPRLGQKRRRAVAASAAAGVITAVVIFAVPFPLSTVSEGVLWFAEESFVRARTDGFVERLSVTPGARVEPGTSLVECSDPLLPARIRVLESQLKELQVKYDMKERTDRVQAQVTRHEIEETEHQLAHARMKAGELTIYSRAEGNFFLQAPQDLPGRFLKRGEVAGYVLNDSSLAARVVVSQSDVDLVRQRTRSVKVRLPERITMTLPAVFIREIPAGSEKLPAKVLGQEGGGEVTIDPRDQKGTTAFQKVFLFDIQLRPELHLFNVGGRVYVRFDHGMEPLAWRWYREVRQLLLRRFNV